MRRFLILPALLMCAACGPSQKSTLVNYDHTIISHSCQQLDTEERFNNQLIAKMTTASETYDPIGDVLVTTFTLGMDTLPSGSSVISKRNYDQKVVVLQEKNKLITKHRSERCI